MYFPHVKIKSVGLKRAYKGIIKGYSYGSKWLNYTGTAVIT